MKNVLKFLANLTPLALVASWLLAIAFWAQQGTASPTQLALLAGTAAALVCLLILNIKTLLSAQAAGALGAYWYTQSLAAAGAFLGGIGVVVLLLAGAFIASSPTNLNTAGTTNSNNSTNTGRNTPPTTRT